MDAREGVSELKILLKVPLYTNQNSMTKKLIYLTLLVFLSFMSNDLLAQMTERQQLAKLSFLMGDWSGTSTVYNKDDTIQHKVQESVKYILGGDAITIDVASSAINLHTLITYSLKDECYYYEPFDRTGASKHKGFLVDNKFRVSFNPTNRLTFEKTLNGEFHEYGEALVDGKWIKYFEDVLLPAATDNFSTIKRQKIVKDYIDPITALTNVVSVEHESFKTIYIAGQVGTGDTKEEQLETAYKSIEKRLAQAGAKFSDLVEMKIYIVDYEPDEDLDMFFRVREKLYGDIKMPPNVFIGISSLYSEEKKIELSGTAILIK